MLVDEIREACACVVEHARWVRIEEGRIEPYARALPARGTALGADPEVALLEGSIEERAAFALTLDAINFGSGWWPEVRKRPGRSGFYTMALGLRERFDAAGPWSPAELAHIEPRVLAPVFGQDPEHELMELYSASLRDLGRWVVAERRGRFAAVGAAAGGSAVALVEDLGQRRCFSDFSTYRGRRVPLLKRAQLACADLHHARVVSFGDLDRLTVFADNVVPHVLRVDGVLAYDDGLAARIDAGELLEHGSEPEVEIRACAVEAVERMVRARPETSAQELDHVLWNRGRGAAYKSLPRHRARSTAY